MSLQLKGCRPGAAGKRPLDAVCDALLVACRPPRLLWSSWQRSTQATAHGAPPPAPPSWPPSRRYRRTRCACPLSSVGYLLCPVPFLALDSCAARA